MVISRNLINQNIVYKDFNQIFPMRDYGYAELSKKIDMFKNLLVNHYNCQPGQRVIIGFQAGIMQSALIFAAAELALKIVVVDYQRIDIDSKIKLLMPIDYFFLDIKKTWIEKINVLDKISKHTIFVLTNSTDWNDFGIYTRDNNGQLVILDIADYTPNNIFRVQADTVLMICTSSGTTGTPKVIEHTHNFIHDLIHRNKSMFYGKVGVNANLQHGSSFATYFLPSIISSSVEVIHSLIGGGLQKYNAQNLDHLLFAYTLDLEAYLNKSPKKQPQLNLYTLSYIKASWKKSLDQGEIKDIISIFGSNETSGPIFVNKLSDENFEETRYTKIDNFYDINLLEDGSLSITLPVYENKVINTNDSFKLNTDGTYSHIGRNDLIRINHLKVNTELYQSKVLELLNANLVYDSVQQTIYLAIWDNDGELNSKVSQLKEFVSSYSENIHAISKFAVLDYTSFLSGVKLDQEMLRDYFRNLND